MFKVRITLVSFDIGVVLFLGKVSNEKKLTKKTNCHKIAKIGEGDKRGGKSKWRKF